MPSMRAMMTAGEALERDNVAGYNCSYLPIDDVKSFDEAMYILLCGTGVGFSVESKYVNKLPEGLITSKMYMNGTLRSWIHYIQIRTDEATQKEHRDVALQAKEIISNEFPLIKEYL
jgi:hypothetical protein